MRDLILVAVGGSLGVVARYGAGVAAAQWLGKGFPWGTLLVNVVGCFLMGLVMEVLLGLESHTKEAITPAIRLQAAFWHKAVAIGFLGGLTTFSSFGGDTLREFQAGHSLLALSNVAANLLLSLGAVWCGIAVMQWLD